MPAPPPPPPPGSASAPFRREGDQLVFSPIPNKGKFQTVQGEKDAAGSVAVPVLAVLRRLAKMGKTETTLQIAAAFGHLARMRSFLADAALLRDLMSQKRAADAVEAHRVRALLEFVASLGFSMPPGVAVEFEGMTEIVAEIEAFFPGRVGPLHGDEVEYVALQEVFPVGLLVGSQAMGGLGGTVIGLRVFDAWFDSVAAGVLGAVRSVLCLPYLACVLL